MVIQTEGVKAENMGRSCMWKEMVYKNAREPKMTKYEKRSCRSRATGSVEVKVWSGWLEPSAIFPFPWLVCCVGLGSWVDDAAQENI